MLFLTVFMLRDAVYKQESVSKGRAQRAHRTSYPVSSLRKQSEAGFIIGAKDATLEELPLFNSL